MQAPGNSPRAAIPFPAGSRAGIPALARHGCPEPGPRLCRGAQDLVDRQPTGKVPGDFGGPDGAPGAARHRLGNANQRAVRVCCGVWGLGVGKWGGMGCEIDAGSGVGSPASDVVLAPWRVWVVLWNGIPCHPVHMEGGLALTGAHG